MFALEEALAPAPEPNPSDVDVKGDIDLEVRRLLAFGDGRGERLSPSPRRISDSTARSRLPLTPLSTMVFRCWSWNPISRSLASLFVNSSWPSDPDEAPKPREDPLGGAAPGDRVCPASSPFVNLASFLAREERGNIEDADRKPNLEFLGGRGGGVPSSYTASFSLLEELATLLVYFCLTNRSIAESASSASTGIFGCLFSGL